MTAMTLAYAQRMGEVVTRGLSSGRRRRCRTMLGDGRGFATDLDAVYFPWPLPQELESGLVPAIALQSSPTKELLAQLPLARLNPRERAALQYVEGIEAMGWAIQFWPGLNTALQALSSRVEPRHTADITAAQLMERALVRAKHPETLPLPSVFGQLPIVRSALVDLAARRSQVESRLPWSSKKRLEKLNNWSIAIAGRPDEGIAAKRSNLPDEDTEERLSNQRKVRLGIPYPEWNAGRQAYREHYVTVFETRIKAAKGHPECPDPRLTAWFEQPLERRWRQRLEDGSDLDVDALVDMRMDQLAGTRYVERLYRDRLPASRDVAVALLIDRSGSLSLNDHLKHEIACANALTAAMDRAGESYGVFAFWSDTRHHVAFEVLRDFDDGQPLRVDESSLRPRGYTRIGAALRHATARLLREPAQRRILLVLGDAVPGDEGYDGDYAVADVEKSVEEAEKNSVMVSFIALGRPAEDPLAASLPHHLVRIGNVDQLAPVLANVHARLAS